MNMLSQENIEKLNENILYKCQPNVKYRGKLFADSLYHCCNWTFRLVKNREGDYFMRDTFWNSGDSVYIHLTDDNIAEFETIFDTTKVKSIKEHETDLYTNHYRVAIDSGGVSYPKYFVDADAKKDKDLIINKIEEEINEYARKIKYLEEDKKRILEGKINLEWY